MSSMLQQLWEWSGYSITTAEIDLICYVLIGLACGLAFRDRRSRLFVGLILGVIGAVPGGLFLKWADLFAHSHFVGAFLGAVVVVGVQRVFHSER
ncbi:hypothetical protein ACFL6S_37435 [Candidatus Poribacteria bacterium]